MRPSSIVQFERVALLALLLSAVGSLLDWDAVLASREARLMGETVVVAAYAAIFLIFLALIFATSRAGSRIAMWVYVLLTVVGIAGWLPKLPRVGELPLANAALLVATFLLSIASIWLLFRPDARAWFSRRR